MAANKKLTWILLMLLNGLNFPCESLQKKGWGGDGTDDKINVLRGWLSPIKIMMRAN